MRTDRTWLAVAIVSAVGIHATAFLFYAPGDVYAFIRPWYRELLAHGFSRPVGNYSPPYLYLLWGLTFLDGLLWQIVLIKLLSIGGAIWLTFAVSRLLQCLGQPRELALFTLLLPSIILDTSLLGQADTFWVAPCVLATAAAVEGKHARVAAWSGLAFAFKAQAAFFAPFVIYLFWNQRAKPLIWAIAPIVFFAAMVPAWLGGWPASHIASIYFEQAMWVHPEQSNFVGNSASWWTVFGYLAPDIAYRLRWVGLPMIIAGLACYWRLLPRPTPRRVVPMAAISAAVVPFLLPMMHDRFFILADVLSCAYAISFPSRRSIMATVAMQIASALPIFVWSFRLQPLECAAVPFALVAIYLLVRELHEGRTNEDPESLLDMGRPLEPQSP